MFIVPDKRAYRATHVYLIESTIEVRRRYRIVPNNHGYRGQVRVSTVLDLPFTNSYTETCRTRTYYLDWCGLSVAISNVVEVERVKTRRRGWYTPDSSFGYDHFIPRKVKPCL